MTLILSGTEVAAFLDLDACRDAVEDAFRAHGNGEAAPPGVLGFAAPGGGFHVKAGLLRRGERSYFAAKVNGNFATNTARGLPRIRGVVLLADGETGAPLALLDSASITTLRTAAATAVAAKHLAREDAAVATLVGCGVQGGAQIRALVRVRPLRRTFLVDADPARARALAASLRDELDLDAEATTDLSGALRASDVVVTCTPSASPLFAAEEIRPGAFVAGVGADAEGKQEIPPALLHAAAVVTDVTSQCAAIGDLHHALAAGALRLEDVRAELGEVVAGRGAGRLSPSEITFFDSTGMALQDVAAAAVAFERGAASAWCERVDLGG